MQEALNLAGGTHGQAKPMPLVVRCLVVSSPADLVLWVRAHACCHLSPSRHLPKGCLKYVPVLRPQHKRRHAVVWTLVGGERNPVSWNRAGGAVGALYASHLCRCHPRCRRSVRIEHQRAGALFPHVMPTGRRHVNLVTEERKVSPRIARIDMNTGQTACGIARCAGRQRCIGRRWWLCM